MLVEIKKILPYCVNKLGLGPVLEFNQLFINWDKILIEAFNGDCKNISRPVSLRNKVLMVDCLNSVWASELQLRQEKICERVNKHFSKEIAKEIRFIC